MDRLRTTYQPRARRTLLICALLAVSTLAVYWPVIHHKFVNLDDHQYILNNPHVLTGLTWENFAAAFRPGYAGNWHPLTWLSHSLDAQLFGANPAGHHV